MQVCVLFWIFVLSCLTALHFRQDVAAVNPKHSTKWSKQLATLTEAQSKVAEQLSAVTDQDTEDGSSDHYCSNVEGEGSDMDLF